MDWYWSWSSNTLATWCEELTIWKDPNAGKNWSQDKKGMTEDEIVGWYHRLNRHEFEQAPGDGDGQGGLACCSPWSHKESDTTERLDWTDCRLPISYLKTFKRKETVWSKQWLIKPWNMVHRAELDLGEAVVTRALWRLFRMVWSLLSWNSRHE